MSTGYCYVAESQSAIKFGYSQAPWSRNLSTEIGASAKVVGYVYGSRIQEAKLHELLRPYRLHGEWYQRHPIVEAAAALFPRRIARTKTNEIVDAAYRANREEARQLLQRAMLPGAQKNSELGRLSEALGIRQRRLRAIWNMEARSISDVELAIIRKHAAAVRSMLLDDGEA